MAYDHLNVIERKLIDNLRTGTYNIVGGTATAWSEGDVTVYGQFPTTDEIKYPCIIAEMTANGLEEQFMGQNLTYSKPNAHDTVAALGELYGVGFNIHVAVNRESVLQAEWTDPTLSTNTTITGSISNTAQLTVGTTIAGTNIPGGTTISSITNGTTFIMSAAATGTASDITATFTAFQGATFNQFFNA